MWSVGRRGEAFAGTLLAGGRTWQRMLRPYPWPPAPVYPLDGSALKEVAHVAIVLLAPFASGAEHQKLALCRYLRARCRVTLLTDDEFATLLATDPFLREYSAGLAVVRLGRAFPSETPRSPRDIAARALA